MAKLNLRKYWLKEKISAGTLKNLCYVYNVRAKQVKVLSRIARKVPISHIIMEKHGDWVNDYLRQYEEILTQYDSIGRNGDFSNTGWWKEEWSNAPKNNKKQVKTRMNRFFNLYDSIKKKGFKRQSNNLPKLIDVSSLQISSNIRGYRISERYYRLLGMKRLFIAHYLGIESVWCRVLTIRIVQL